MPHQQPPYDADQLRLWHRLAEQIALPDVAADPLQLVTLVRRLDPFSHGLQPEAPRQLDDGFA
jgi:hypothetical protein